MRASGLCFVALTCAACGGAPFVGVEVLDRPTLPGECIEVAAQDGEATPIRATRLVRDGGSRYVLGFSDPKRRSALWFQAQVLSRCEDAPKIVRGESERREAIFGDGGAASVTLVVRVVDEDGDGVRAADAGGGDCNDGDPAVSPLATEQCQLLVDANCDGRRGCDDPQCGASALCAQRLHFTEPGPEVTAGVCALVEVARARADGGLLFDGRDQVRFAAATSAGPADVLFSSALCDSRLDGGVTAILPNSAVARAWLRAKDAGALTLSAEWDFAPAARSLRIVPGPAVAAELALPPAVVAGDCAPGSLSVFDRFGNPTAVDGGSISVTFFAGGGALFADGGCATPVATLQAFSGTRSLPVFFRSTVAGTAVVAAQFAGTDAGQRLVQVSPGPPQQLSFGRWDPAVRRFECLPFALRAFDRFGNVATAPVDAALSAAPGTLAAEFFTDPSCGATLAGPLPLLDGGGGGSVRFGGSGFGAFEATAAGLPTASVGVSLSGGVTIEAALPPTVIEAGGCVPVTFSRRMPDGGLHLRGVLVAGVETPRGARVAFAQDARCGPETGALTLTFADGESSVVGHLKGLSGPGDASVPVRALEDGGPASVFSVVPLPLVRRGDCSLVGATSRRCVVAPPVPGDDVSRTFLVMQSTSDGVEPNTMATECHLEADAGVFVVCSRAAATGAVRVQWQTVSFGRPADAGGLSVRHWWGLAPDASVTAVPGLVTGRSFVLLSYSQTGGTAEDHDHYAAVLDGGGFTVTAIAPNDSASNAVSVQVVELAEPGGVDHVDQWLATNAVAWNTPVPGPAASLTATSVLTSVQANVTGNHVCGRSFTATPSMTDVQVNRGLADATCLNGTVLRRVSVQRIRWPWAAQVVAATGAVLLGPGTGVLPVAATRVVALDRSLTWLGGQGMGGQSWGQVSYFAPDAGEDDATGAATGVLVPDLTSPGLAFSLVRGSSRGTAAFLPTFIEFAP